MNVRWPVQADARVRTFMHGHNYYDPDDADHKIVDLVKGLRKGTEIENCEPRHYTILKQRLIERVGILVESLLSKGLLERQNGRRPQKTPVFSDYWDHRHGSWAPNYPSSKKASLSNRRQSVYNVPDDDNIDDDADIVEPSSSFSSQRVQRGIPKVRLSQHHNLQ